MQRHETTSSARAASTPRVPAKSAEELAFAAGSTELGVVLIARSVAGVCSIVMGSDDEELREGLAMRFPDHTLVRDDAKLAADLRSIQRFIETPAAGLDLALDVRGTPWQRRVWSALLGVPAGATVTYSALAARVGEPGAARAVARACAENAIALAIPCHRIIRKDGTLSGYRWGVERKRALLAKEAAQ
jgi:methylated-DNA-[protein]-cysteine S-methyltransferase/AraC family transcriptional regulator of adaptative response/methylated-DNA-[protein]-cysteine methyltransferase